MQIATTMVDLKWDAPFQSFSDGFKIASRAGIDDVWYVDLKDARVAVFESPEDVNSLKLLVEEVYTELQEIEKINLMEEIHQS